MNRTILLCVPGINTFPGDAKNWNLRAGTWVNRAAPAAGCRAQSIEYFCGPLGRAFGQQRRALNLCELLTAYAGWEIHLVAHSNGAAVTLLALELAGWPPVAALHLVSAACGADFWANGLNQALGAVRPDTAAPQLLEKVRLRQAPPARRLGSVGRVLVYSGGKDRALRLASGWLGRALGYGVLGLHGPQNVAPEIADRVGVLNWPEYGHSTCWAAELFDQTMKHFLPT